MGSKFEVNVSDLKPGSRALVQIKCDYCGAIYEAPYSTYLKSIKTGKNACKKCLSTKIKESNLKNYGVENVFQLETIKEKSKKSILERYGVENVSQSQEIQEKIKENNVKKYGVTNTSKLDYIKEKVKESNQKKFGVDYPMQLPEFREHMQETDMKKYGVPYHIASPLIREKGKQTLYEHYGVTHPTQNREILNKSLATRYQHGNFTCSKQQYKLYEYIGGELNYPFMNFVIDIAFPEEKIAVEWDGSGHDLSVRMGYITEQEFKRNENFRNITLFNNDWKIIRFITKKDIFPEHIISIFNYCKSYIDNGGHKISVLIDENKIHFKNQYIDIQEII